jgi:hypothetical protein
MHKMSCEEVHEVIPQFALDILPSQARASLASHLLRCASCRVKVAAAQSSAAQLLYIAEPSGESDDVRTWDPDSCGPWDTHESEGWDPEQPSWSDDEQYDASWNLSDSEAQLSPRRSRLRMVVAIATAGLLIIGTTLGPELSQSSPGKVIPIAQAQLLTASNQPVGYVYFLAGSRHEIEVRVLGIQGVSHLTLELLGTAGNAMRVGQFAVIAGKGAWAAPSSMSASEVAEVIILDPSGSQVASAMVA